MSRFIAAVLAAALCAGQAAAQDTPPPAAPFTLDDALAAARAVSPALEAASADLRASSAARTVAGLRPNPTLQAETENVAGSGAYRGIDSAETTIGFALPVELGGKRSARIGVANALSGRARIDAAIAQAAPRRSRSSAPMFCGSMRRRRLPGPSARPWLRGTRWPG